MSKPCLKSTFSSRMRTSSNGNIFRIAGHLCGEFAGRAPVNSPFKSQCRGALMFPLICAWINGWVNNGEAGDLRRHCAHYDVTVILGSMASPQCASARGNVLTFVPFYPWFNHPTINSKCRDISKACIWYISLHPFWTYFSINVAHNNKSYSSNRCDTTPNNDLVIAIKALSIISIVWCW